MAKKKRNIKTKAIPKTVPSTQGTFIPIFRPIGPFHLLHFPPIFIFFLIWGNLKKKLSFCPENWAIFGENFRNFGNK